MNREELTDMLVEFDKDAQMISDDPDLRLSVVIVGGSAFVLTDFIVRATHDIDILSASGKLAILLEKYNMNTAVAAFADSFPYNFEERMVKLELETKAVDFYTPALEDLVVSKLYAMRPPDVADITSPEVLKNLDWHLLENLVYGDDEASASALIERRYKDMVLAYEQYKKEYNHEKTNL